MLDVADLLELLYNAHRGVAAMFVEVRDWVMPEASHVLIVDTRHRGQTRARWAAGGPNPTPAESRRRVWFRPPDRIRVDMMHGPNVVRAAVRDGPAWWHWDQDSGESAGNLASGARVPGLLDLTLLHPARLLHTMWFEVSGEGVRAGREVLKASGVPREALGPSRRDFEFEFDREHGTPLRIAAFEAGGCVTSTETLAIDFEAGLDPDVFLFDRGPRDQPKGRRSSRSRSLMEPMLAEERRAAQPLSGIVTPQTIWISGGPEAAPTAIARATEQMLQQLGVACCLLDGEALRQGLGNSLGTSRADRSDHVNRVAYIAATLVGSGVLAIVAFGGSDADSGGQARALHAVSGLEFLDVWIDAPAAAAEISSETDVGSRVASLVADADGRSGGARAREVTKARRPSGNPVLRVSSDNQPPRVAASQIVATACTTAARTQVYVPRRM